MITCHCPRCTHEFEAEPFDTGACVVCGNDFWMDEVFAEDFSDSWIDVYWSDYKPRCQDGHTSPAAAP